MEELPQKREMLSLPELEGFSSRRTAQAAEGAEHLLGDKPIAFIHTDQSTGIPGASHTPNYSICL